MERSKNMEIKKPKRGNIYREYLVRKNSLCIIYKIYDPEDDNYEEWYGDPKDIIEYIKEIMGWTPLDKWENIVTVLNNLLGLEVEEIYRKKPEEIGWS